MVRHDVSTMQAIKKLVISMQETRQTRVGHLRWSEMMCQSCKPSISELFSMQETTMPRVRHAEGGANWFGAYT